MSDDLVKKVEEKEDGLHIELNKEKLKEIEEANKKIEENKEEILSMFNNFENDLKNKFSEIFSDKK